VKPSLALLIVGTLYLGVGWMLSAIGPSLPALARQAGHEVTDLGAIFTAFSLGGVLASVGVGAAIQRWGLRTVIAAGSACMGAGMLALGLSPLLAGMLIGAGMAGFGYGGMLAGGNLLIARLYHGAAGALNALNLFFSVGSIGGPLLVALMLAVIDQPQAAIWMGAVLMLGLVWPGIAPARTDTGTVSADVGGSALVGSRHVGHSDVYLHRYRDRDWWLDSIDPRTRSWHDRTTCRVGEQSLLGYVDCRSNGSGLLG
jgi:Major Facilitator Superfamily.